MCHSNEHNYQRSPKRAVHNCRNIRQRVKTRPVATGEQLEGNAPQMVYASKVLLFPENC